MTLLAASGYYLLAAKVDELGELQSTHLGLNPIEK